MPRIRYTSGGREGELLARAKQLRKDPSPLLPRLADDCPTGPFDRIRRDLEAVHEAREDLDDLERLQGKGEELARAYAGLLHYASERPDLVTLVARYPTGEIPYLPVAKTSVEALIATQYHDDPRRLLLGYVRLAKGGFLGGGGFHFYALERGILCTGKQADPPEEFVRATLERQPYRLGPPTAPATSGSKEDRVGLRVCQHLARGEAEEHLVVRWRSVGRTLQVCERCASEEAHLLASLSENMVIPNPDAEFEVEAVLPLHHEHPGACPLAKMPPLSTASERRYRAGRISDAEVLQAHAQEINAAVASVRGALYVAGGRCFGGDVEALLKALDPTPAERRALGKVLPTLEAPLICPEARAGKVVEMLWKEHAVELLRAAGASPEEAQRRAAESRSAPGRASEVLNRFAQQRKEEATLAKLPAYVGLTPEAALADRVARLYRTSGPAEVERFIARESPPEGKVRGLAWSFLAALGKASSQAWRFSDTEQEFGAALSAAALRLLEAPPEGYDAALNALLLEAGIPSWGTRVQDA